MESSPDDSIRELTKLLIRGGKPAREDTIKSQEQRNQEYLIMLQEEQQVREQQVRGVAWEEVWKPAMVAGLALLVGWWAQSRRTNDVSSPKGALIDWLTPPEHAEHRVEALQYAYETRWLPKYGRWSSLLFLIQSIGAVASFWINWLLKRAKLLSLWQSE